MNTIISIKTLTFITIFILSFLFSFSQEISINHITKFGSSGWDGVNSIDTLPNNRIVLAGSLRAILEGDSLISTPDDNAWIVCLDTNNDILWQKILNGPKFQSITSISNNIDEFLYAGLFQDTLFYDSSYISTDKFIGGFIMSIDSLGSIKWIREINISGNIENVKVSGNKSNSYAAVFYGDSIKNFEIFNILPQGSINSLFKFTNKDLNVHSFMAKDSTLLTCISYKDSISLIDTTIYSNENYISTLIIKMNYRGKIDWVKKIEGNNNTVISSIFLSHTNQIYLIGHFKNTIILENNILTSNGAMDIFILKLTPDGIIDLFNNIGGIGNDYGHDIFITEDNMYVSGAYYNTIGIETYDDRIIEFESSSPYGNAFILKLDTIGNALAMYTLSSEAETYCNEILCRNHHIIAAGNFYDTIPFGTEIVSSNGDKDIFLLSFQDPCYDYNLLLDSVAVLCKTDTIFLVCIDTSYNCYWQPGNINEFKIPVTSEGNYYVTAINNQGCISTDSIQITEQDLPKVQLEEKILYIPGNSVILEGIQATNYNNVFWESTGSGYFTEPNNLNTVYNPSCSDIANGFVYIILNLDNPCGTIIDSIMIYVDTNDDNIIAYPNPTNGFLRLISQNSIVIEDITLTLQNGIIIYSEFGINDTIFEYNLTGIPPGTILVYINTNEGMVCKVINKL